MTEKVRTERHGVVTTITIDRPEHLNALDGETLDGIESALEDATDARALIVTGAGDDAFVAGADVGRMKDLSTVEAHRYAEQGHRVMDAIESHQAPSIAAINGYALGGGCELALACDLRVASDNAVIGQPEMDLGIVPGWGGTQRLSRLVGDERARRLVFFGTRLSADEAEEVGLVGEVVSREELDDHVMTLARELASKPRFAIASAKEALNQVHQAPQATGLAYERRLWSGLFGTDDQREGMAAFLEKREAEFD